MDEPASTEPRLLGIGRGDDRGVVGQRRPEIDRGVGSRHIGVGRRILGIRLNGYRQRDDEQAGESYIHHDDGGRRVR